MFKSILCLDGSLPPKSTIIKFLKRYKMAKLIAVDGAANQLLNKGIIPDYVMGDFDSFEYDTRILPENLITLKDQNYTDFEKSLAVLKERKLYPILVLGINGGELDHVIDNINKFIKYSADIPMVLFDYNSKSPCPKWGIVIKNSLTFNANKDSTTSIFPFTTNTRLQSNGLHWELNASHHGIFEHTSTRNRTKISSQCTIKADKDKTLLIINSKTYPFDL